MTREDHGAFCDALRAVRAKRNVGQSQEALAYQMGCGVGLASAAGLYDLADFLRDQVEQAGLRML